MLRTDLELDAHMHGTLHPSSVLVLERGNRIEQARSRRDLGASSRPISPRDFGGASHHAATTGTPRPRRHVAQERIDAIAIAASEQDAGKSCAVM